MAILGSHGAAEFIRRFGLSTLKIAGTDCTGQVAAFKGLIGIPRGSGEYRADFSCGGVLCVDHLLVRPMPTQHMLYQVRRLPGNGPFRGQARCERLAPPWHRT